MNRNFLFAHPSEEQLALFATGDLSFFAQLGVRLHVRGCAACRGLVADHRQIRQALSKLGHSHIEESLPAHLRWDELASEMQANIRLGLEASQAIAAFDRPEELPQEQLLARERFLNYRAAFTVASICAVFGGLWWYGVTLPRMERERVAAAKAPVVVESGVGMVVSYRQGTRLELKAPSSQASLVTVSTGGSAESAFGTMGTQYVDHETGQVTITNVYTD